jgi:hypothetical protein
LKECRIRRCWSRVTSLSFFLSADEDRILITHDHRTPGVFIIPQQISVGAAIEELLLVWSSSEADEWINRILYLPM